MKKFTILNKKSKKIEENIQESPTKTISVNPDVNVLQEQTSCVKFFSKLFESKEMAHVYHLQVKGDEGSYSSHIALGEFYEKMPELIDELIEVYMGQYDVVEGYDVIDTNVSRDLNPLEYFMGIGEFIKSERYSSLDESDTHIQSIVDEILNCVFRLTYKLKYNK